MKNKICLRVIAFALMLAVVCTVSACSQKAKPASEVKIPDNLSVDVSGNKKGSPVVQREYTTLYSENDSLLYKNPNRGMTGYIDFYHFNISDEELYSYMDQIFKKFEDNLQARVYRLYFYPGDYRGKHLDDTFYSFAEKVFQYCREHNVQILLQFAYYDVNNFNDRTPTTEEIMLHINDLKQNGLIERNKDVIHVFQCGFVGRFGEWHSENTPTDHKVIVNSLLELLPDGIFTQIRYPEVADLVEDSNPLKKMIGYDNGCYFGIQNSSDLGGGTFSYGTPGYDYVMNKAGAYTPNYAECYYYTEFKNVLGFYPDGYACLLGASQMHLTNLNGSNGYLDQGALKDGAMVRWKNQPVTEKWLKEYGLPYSENWFKNAEGKTVERSCFDFIRNYLGYRFTAEKLITEKSGENNLSVKLDLKNNGFAAAFNITSSLVILDKDGKEVSSAEAGNPMQWYPTNPDDYSDREQLTHEIKAELKLPEKSGEYRLALKLLSTGGGTARLDNNIPFEDGCNILHTFTVK